MTNVVKLFAPHKQAQFPSLPAMAANAAGAAARAAVRVLRGDPVKAPPDVQEARWAACRACLRYVADQQRCSLCGCYARSWLVGKVELAAERCPDTSPRWGPWDGQKKV